MTYNSWAAIFSPQDNVAGLKTKSHNLETKIMKKTLLACFVSLALVQGCTNTSSNATATTETAKNEVAAKTESEKLIALTESFLEETLPRAPLNAMFFGDSRFNHLWPNNITEGFISDGDEINRRYLKKLAKLDADKLSGQDKYTYDIFKVNLETFLEGSDYPAHLLPVNQFVFSPHNVFMQLGAGLSAQPFNNAQDFDNFLQRGEGFVVWMHQAIDNMRTGIKQNVVHARPVVESMLPQLKAQVLEDPETSMLLGPLNNAGDKLTDEEKTRLKAEYVAFISEKLTPAFAAMSEFVENEYLPNARDTHGYGQLPNGKKWYEFMLKINTTLPLTAEQIHQTGLAEVARVHDEMRQVAKEVGFEGDLKAFMEYLKTDPQFFFESPDEVLQAYTDLKDKIAPLVPKLFSVIPKADYILRAYPEAQAKSAPGASYIPGAPDGSRPGVFFANTFNLKAQPKYGTETLSIHEAVPGHHFQISLQTEVEGVPRIRKQNFYTVYAEGWALYAESLGKEMGLFTDPYQYFGKLSAELFRSMRLVVDTGLHAKGWSREQAIQYMLDNSTMTDSDATSEIERYMILPGQATAYKTGQLKIQELREYAESKLGDKFDIKHFHNLILLDGPLPMPLLEKKIREYAASEKS